jgi:hypothetical protein
MVNQKERTLILKTPFLANFAANSLRTRERVELKFGGKIRKTLALEIP